MCTRGARAISIFEACASVMKSVAERLYRIAVYAYLFFQRFHMGNQGLGLVLGNAFCFVAWHVGRLLCLLPFENYLNEVSIGKRRIEFLFCRCSMTGHALRFVSSCCIKVLIGSPCCP